MPVQILSVKLLDTVWIVRFLRADGKKYQSQLSEKAFETVQASALGQVMFQAWLSKATPIPDEP